MTADTLRPDAVEADESIGVRKLFDAQTEIAADKRIVAAKIPALANEYVGEASWTVMFTTLATWFVNGYNRAMRKFADVFEPLKESVVAAMDKYQREIQQ